MIILQRIIIDIRIQAVFSIGLLSTHGKQWLIKFFGLRQSEHIVEH